MDREDLKLLIAFTSALSVVLGFGLILSLEDGDRYRKCVERTRANPDECALIIYGR